MPVASNVMPSSRAESSRFLSRSSARSNTAFKDGLSELRRGIAFGTPGGGGQDAAGVAAYRPDLAARVLDPQPGIVEDLAQELLHVTGVDPCRAEAGVDLAG